MFLCTGILTIIVHILFNIVLTSALQLEFVPNDATVDSTPAFNQALTRGESQIEFPQGTYYFKTPPQRITSPLMISGAGVNTTNFRRVYDEADMQAALLTSTATLHLSNLSITSDGTGGGAVKLDGLGASGSVLRDLYISASAGHNWAIPVTLYSTDPLGIRTCVIDNVNLFAATVQIAWLVNVQGLRLNLNAYPAGGTVNKVTIQHYGPYRSNNVMIETQYLDELHLYNTTLVNVRQMNTKIVPHEVKGLKVF